MAGMVKRTPTRKVFTTQRGEPFFNRQIFAVDGQTIAALYHLFEIIFKQISNLFTR